MQIPFRDLALGLGPARYWRLDDVGSATAREETGHTAGTYNGTTLQKGVPGLLTADTNRACRFNGAGDYVSAPTAAELQGDVAFEVWALVRPASLANYRTICGLLSAGDLGWWLQIDANGAVLFQTSRDGVTQNAAQTPNGTIVAGNQYVIRASYDGRRARVSVNEGTVYTYDWGSSAALHTVVAGTAFAIGRSGAFATDYFVGEIDEVLIFQASITPTVPISVTDRARLYSSMLGRASFDLDLPRVRWRAARPPHGVLFETDYSGLRYGFQLGAGQTASFQVPRTLTRRISDGTSVTLMDWLRNELTRGEMPMVTIERPDKALPFVGFVTQIPRMDDADPYATITLKDHWSRLSAARTALSGSVSGSSGLLIANAVKEAAGRAKPPLFLDLALLPTVSPAANFDLRANKLDQFIRALEKQTGWEAFFTYDIDERHVTTYLAWASKRGFDRRNAQTLMQGRQLSAFGYPLDFEAGVSSGVAVGGTGTFSGRTSVEVAAQPSSQVQGYGVLPKTTFRTDVAISQQVTDKRVLTSGANYLLTTPENSVASITASLLEAETDMRSIGVGDIRRVVTNDGFLGASTVHLARIVAMEMHPAEGVHDLQLVEV